MKTEASCLKLPKKQTCKRKVNRKIELFPGPIKLSEARTIGLDIYSCFLFRTISHFKVALLKGLLFMNKHKQKDVR